MKNKYVVITAYNENKEIKWETNEYDSLYQAKLKKSKEIKWRNTITCCIIDEYGLLH